jgi:hypothetical protein
MGSQPQVKDYLISKHGLPDRGTYLHQVRKVEEELTLRFPDGARVVMKDEDAYELDQASRRRKIRQVRTAGGAQAETHSSLKCFRFEAKLNRLNIESCLDYLPTYESLGRGPCPNRWLSLCIGSLGTQDWYVVISTMYSVDMIFVRLGKKLIDINIHVNCAISLRFFECEFSNWRIQTNRFLYYRPSGLFESGLFKFIYCIQ